MNSLEQLFDTQLKADILRLFHNNVHRLSETAEQIAKRLGSNTAETERDLEDLASRGLLKKTGIMKKVIGRTSKDRTQA